MAFRVDGFDWDDGNRGKCRKHGLAPGQIEALFRSGPWVWPDLAHSETETRFRAIGRIEGRWLFVVFTIRVIAGRRLIRPISARYMHHREVEHYERQQKFQDR